VLCARPRQEALEYLSIEGTPVPGTRVRVPYSYSTTQLDRDMQRLG